MIINKLRMLYINNKSIPLPQNLKTRVVLISIIQIVIMAIIFYKSIWAVTFGLFLIPVLVNMRLKRKVYEQKSELTYQFRDMLYSISASVSSGRHLPEALVEARENMKLIYGDDGMMVLELNKILKGLYESKESEEQVLMSFSKRTGIEDIEDFVEIYLTCRSTGGDLERIIVKSANMIMEKISIQREIQMLTAQKKFEGKLLTALPFVVIGFLELTSPEYLSVMYETFQGRITMTLALIGICLAHYITLQVTSIDI